MKSVKKIFTALLLASVFVPTAASGAETVHLYLKAAGTEIKGESNVQSLGRQDSIQCLYFEHAAATALQAGTGMATGRRQYAPILIRKRIDKSSPLIMKAMRMNQPIEGVFKFFRPSPTGDGTTEQFYTIWIKSGRIASVKQFLPDVTAPATSALPPLEEVTFVFGGVQWIYTNGGITDADSWSANR